MRDLKLVVNLHSLKLSSKGFGFPFWAKDVEIGDKWVKVESLNRGFLAAWGTFLSGLLEVEAPAEKRARKDQQLIFPNFVQDQNTCTFIKKLLSNFELSFEHFFALIDTICNSPATHVWKIFKSRWGKINLEWTSEQTSLESLSSKTAKTKLVQKKEELVADEKIAASNVWIPGSRHKTQVTTKSAPKWIGDSISCSRLLSYQSLVYVTNMPSIHMVIYKINQ